MVRSTGPAACFQRFDDIPRLSARLRVEPGGGLVEKEQLRFADQSAAERQPLLLAAGERAHVRAGLFLEADEPQNRRDVQTAWIEAAEQREHFADLQLLREFGLLQLDAESRAQPLIVSIPAIAEHLDLAGVGIPETFEDLDRRGLPRAVGAQHAEALAGAHLEIEAIDGHRLAITLDELTAAQRRLWIGWVGHEHPVYSVAVTSAVD